MRRAGLVPKVVLAEGEGEAYEAAQALLRSGLRPTAIFAGYDTLAISALRAIAEVGAQSEISVAGYDGTELAAHPLISLTTIDQFGAQMGARAVDLLMERIRGTRTTAVHRQIGTELRIRSSTRTAVEETAAPA